MATKEQQDLDCCLCGDKIKPHYDHDYKPVWFKGHNAEPLKKGRCCDICNISKVLPERIRQINI